MSGGKETMCEIMFFFSVQVCLDPWTVQRQADLRIYLFLGRKGMFLCFYVKKIVPVDMALEKLLGLCKDLILRLLLQNPKQMGDYQNWTKWFRPDFRTK